MSSLADCAVANGGSAFGHTAQGWSWGYDAIANRLATTDVPADTAVMTISAPNGL